MGTSPAPVLLVVNIYYFFYMILNPSRIHGMAVHLVGNHLNSYISYCILQFLLGIHTSGLSQKNVISHGSGPSWYLFEIVYIYSFSLIYVWTFRPKSSSHPVVAIFHCLSSTHTALLAVRM